MNGRRTLAGLILLGLGVLGACTAANDDGTGEQTPAQQVGPGGPAPGGPAQPGPGPGSAMVDVASQSQVSLALRGSLGPALEGLTVTRAVVTIQDVELVDASGASVVLMRDAVTTDLLSIQNTLQQVAQDVAVQAGQFTRMRFQMTSAWVQTADAQGGAEVFATQGVDVSQFSGMTVNQLQLGGIDSAGYVEVALPQEGIAVQNTASLALQFDLAQSLTVQSSNVWVLTPTVWAVDQSMLSAVDVQFQASTAEYVQAFSEGYGVMLLDANQQPVCAASLVQYSSTAFYASFQYIDASLGPFVAVLLPPPGITMSSTVAVQVVVQTSVTVTASIAVTSFTRVSSSSVTIATSSQASIVQTATTGAVVGRTTQPIGPIEDVAPHQRPREPLRPGAMPPPPAETPLLPGLPPPRGRDAGAPTPPPPFADAGAPPPPVHLDGGMPPPPVHLDGGMPPPMMTDAGGPPPRMDAGGPPPPPHDAGGPPPRVDAGGPPPPRDAGGPPPGRDAGRPPPRDAGAPPPVFDAGPSAPPPGPRPTPTTTTGLAPLPPTTTPTTGRAPLPPTTTPTTGPAPLPPTTTPTTGPAPLPRPPNTTPSPVPTTTTGPAPGRHLPATTGPGAPTPTTSPWPTPGQSPGTTPGPRARDGGA